MGCTQSRDSKAEGQQDKELESQSVGAVEDYFEIALTYMDKKGLIK